MLTQKLLSKIIYQTNTTRAFEPWLRGVEYMLLKCKVAIVSPCSKERDKIGLKE
jgi:hypothetical protein